MKSSNKQPRNRNRNRNRRRYRQPQELIGEKEFRTKLVFCAGVANTSGNFAHHYIRGNSAYDPAVWTTAVRPALGFQQLAELYNFYECKASRLEVTVMNTSGTSAGFPPTDLGKLFTLVAYPAPYMSQPNSLANAMEQPGARYVTMTPPRTSGAVRKMTFPWTSTRAMFGTEADDEDFKANTANSPTREWVWHLYLSSPINSQLHCTTMIKVEYDILFYDRRRIPPQV